MALRVKKAGVAVPNEESSATPAYHVARPTGAAGLPFNQSSDLFEGPSARDSSALALVLFTIIAQFTKYTECQLRR
jgi:hypothetical protein